MDVYYDLRDPGNTVQMGKFDYSNAAAATLASALFELIELGLFWISW